MARLASWWRNLTERQRVETELNDELQAAFDLLVDEGVARGLAPDEARRVARLELGSAESLKEQVRDVRQGATLDNVAQDVRFALRQFRRSPGFTAVAVVTLALGIGANAAIFGVVKSLLLDALPYQQADRLIRVYGRLTDGTPGTIGWRAEVVQRIGQRQRSLELLAAFDSPRDASFGSGDGLRVVKVLWVEPRLFKTLGVEAVLGRTLSDEDRPVGYVPASGAEVGSDTARAVMITFPAWQRLFSGDLDVIGREVRINGVVRSVIGVLPRGFVGPSGPGDFYLGFDLAPAVNVGAGWLGIVGRLRPGITADMARREYASLDIASPPGSKTNSIAEALPMRDALVGGTRTPLLVLLASAGMVLLMACTNLTGVLLSRSLSRRKELAVRAAMGAGRVRLVRQLFTESMVLALMGGVAGLAVAQAALVVMRSLIAPLLPPIADLSLDPAGILAIVAVAVLAGLGLGAAPAWSIARAEPQASLGEESRATTESRRSGRLRGALMAAQVALCASLLAGAGLLTRSLWEITTSPLGFDAQGIVAATVRLLPGDYPTLASRTRFQEELLDRVRTLPGVKGAAIANKPPAIDPRRDPFRLEGEPSGSDRMVVYTSVSDDYFGTLRVPLREGRTFDESDREGGPLTVVLSETLARRSWPSGQAIGSRILMGGELLTVIGVVGDVRNDPTQPGTEPQAYRSRRQESTGRVCLLLRTAGDPSNYAKAIQREVAAIDPSLPVISVAGLDLMVGDVLAPRRLSTILLGTFGLLALVLAAVGVYAMFAGMAAAREREFGVRFALGARPRAIATLIVREGGLWMLLGLSGGALGILLVARILNGWLYGIPALDPVAVGGAAALLLICATAALLIPVLRATRVDPMIALRAE